MQHKLFSFTAVLLLGLGLTGLQVQETVKATGGNASPFNEIASGVLANSI